MVRAVCVLMLISVRASGQGDAQALLAYLRVHERAYELPGGPEAISALGRLAADYLDVESAHGVLDAFGPETAAHGFELRLVGTGDPEEGVRVSMATGSEQGEAPVQLGAHRAVLPASRARGEPLIEFWVDINALRRTDAVGDGDWLERQLLAWQVRQGREVMVHVRYHANDAPFAGVVEVDLTYERRRDAPGTVLHDPITPELSLVDHVAATPPGVAWVCVAPTGVSAWVRRVRAARGWGQMGGLAGASVSRMDALTGAVGIVAGFEAGEGEDGVALVVPMGRAQAGASVASDLRRLFSESGGEQEWDSQTARGNAAFADSTIGDVAWGLAGERRGTALVLSLEPSSVEAICGALTAPARPGD